MAKPRDPAAAARAAFNERFDGAADPAAERSEYFRGLSEKARAARHRRRAQPVVLLVIGRDVPPDVRLRDLLEAAMP